MDAAVLDRNGQPQRGRLQIYFGYAEGVGKTRAMLDDAQVRFRCGTDVLIGFMEPDANPEITDLVRGLPALPQITTPLRDGGQAEFDLDSALIRKPALIVVDELAHSNAPGMRNKQRYQDVEELLHAGIDVYTTVNLQNLESLTDVVQSITGKAVSETVPDSIFDCADKVKLIDVDPEELLYRVQEGRLNADGECLTVQDFYSSETLRLLREIALRKATERISQENLSEPSMSGKISESKLLVCIGASPSSAKCIRWTARAAEAFHAPWTAVYVQSQQSDSLSDKQNDTLRANMVLAERLGAEVVTLVGFDIAPAIAEYARLSGITNIVVGKSRNRRTLRNLFEQDFEDKLISLIPGVEVHIIPDNTGRTFRQPMRLMQTLSFSWLDTLKLLGVFALATLACFFAQDLPFDSQNIVMIYILSVLIISRVTTGYLYGVVASVLSVLAFNFFFTYPYFSFQSLAGYPITFAIMLIVALITGALTVRIKAQARLAAHRERRTQMLYEISRKLLVTRGRENIAKLINEYIIKLFGRSVAFYTDDPAQNAPDILQAPGKDDAANLRSNQEQAAAHWAYANQKPAGAGTDTLAQAAAYYLPVISQGKSLGVLGISYEGGPLDQSHFILLRLIASQVAMALERQNLSDEQRQILLESEKEKMRSNLLRAISHDLRTPLTGILGASSVILENGKALDQATHDQLVLNIREDSQWLIRMVENLLSVTRIKEGTMDVAKTPEAAEEIVAEAVRRIRKRFPSHTLHVQVPDELILIPMDGTLIVQVLINLLENAIKHSTPPSPIEVYVRRAEDFAIFEVTDHGEGIADQDITRLFDGFTSNRIGPDSSRGMGIGLSICKSIISAHGGRLEAKNNSTGGATFRFTLPM